MVGGRCLVLNASMELIHVTPSWWSGWKLVERGKASALAHYDDTARSGNTEHQIPAVVVLKRYVKIGRRRPSFSFPSKRNILIRDGFKCAYCSCSLTMASCTKDHVHPISRGGKDELTNVVSACWKCNNIKGSKTVAEAGMTLRIKPRELTDEEKIAVLVKTHRAHERQVWVSCLKQNNLTLF